MTRTISVLIAPVAIVAILAIALAMPTRSAFDAAHQAEADRLNGQATAAQELARQERADAAYSARLAAQADAYFERRAQQERAAEAWTDRLNGLARDNGIAVGISPRVAAAWTARLDGLAEYLSAEE
jgi:sialic acid synthase SpsE